MTKHTPGPWSIALAMGATDEEQKRGEPLRPCYHEIKSDGKIIATTWCGCHEANARLIAAAPDMLEALQFLDRLALLDMNSAARERVRAAIAKATGNENDPD